MKALNSSVLNLTVGILDRLYKGKDIQRFWVLETIARAPYFAFLSVLHFRESLGLRNEAHFYLMKEHFLQTVNETEHLVEMESRGGHKRWIDRVLAYHLVLIYYWANVIYYTVDPVSAYHLSAEVERHAGETYSEYLTRFPDDQKIVEIRDDELHHYNELLLAMKAIDA